MAWIDDYAILSQRPPPFLIESVLPERAVCALVGEPGLGKTFIALDLAFSLAAGTDWHGYPTRRSVVAYIIAEGLGGMPSRVKAWRQFHAVVDQQPLGVHFWRDAVQLASEVAVREFCSHLGGLPQQPGLVVVDTLARCFVGKDENHARDMGEFIRGVDALRATGASVLVVHHTGHLTTRERGSTALRGAVDTLVMVQRANGGLVLKCDKQREAEAFDPIGLKLRDVELGEDERSAVVEAADISVIDAAMLPANWLRATEQLGARPAGMQPADWLKTSGMSRTTFYRMVDQMCKSGCVEKINGVYRRKDTNGAG